MAYSADQSHHDAKTLLLQARNFAIIVTDGKSDNRTRTVRAAINARRSDVTTMVVGVGACACVKAWVAMRGIPRIIGVLAR